MTPDPDGPGEVRAVTFLGASVECRVAVAGVELRVRDTGSGVAIPATGSRVRLSARVTPHPLTDSLAAPARAGVA
jgi:hypothetical protein